MRIKLAHGNAYVEKISGFWCLVSIVVDADYRGKGIGTRLMTNVLKRCGRPLFLLVADELGGDPARLKAFYARFGFVPYHQKRKDGLPFNANMVLES